MPLYNKDKFLEEVLSYIKFPYDRNDIKQELDSHIIDKIECYKEQGCDIEAAEKQAIEDMGDAKNIGIELNKQHNPIIGWIWKITNVLLVLTVILSIFVTGTITVASLFSANPIRNVPKSNIVYKLDVNEKAKIDDTVVHITNVIYHENGDLSIFYNYNDTRLWGTGWSGGAFGEISDNLGNKYFAGSGMSSGGIVTKSVRTARDFSKEADTLIIIYDHYNRYYKIEIPLKVGENHD